MKEIIPTGAPTPSRVQRVDTSVPVTDMYEIGPARGEIALDLTMRKPEAYRPNPVKEVATKDI